MRVIEDKTFDEERALYGEQEIHLKRCAFDGPADGESALKECSFIEVEDSFCNLRYPFWHDHKLKISGTELTPLCRAALWYSDHIEMTGCSLHGIKALRECRDVSIEKSDIRSDEFGWSVRNVELRHCTAEGGYFMLRSENLKLSDVRFQGKYAFQYTKNLTIENCVLDTKDAFWHAEQVTVKNSVVKGEYLAWYSHGLTLEGCRIIGTQPFCYCTDLKLIDCEMIDTDLCFEKSQVNATITTPVASIKNPRSGAIYVPAVGEMILDDPLSKGKILVRGQKDGGLQNKPCA